MRPWPGTLTPVQQAMFVELANQIEESMDLAEITPREAWEVTRLLEAWLRRDPMGDLTPRGINPNHAP